MLLKPDVEQQRRNQAYPEKGEDMKQIDCGVALKSGRHNQ